MEIAENLRKLASDLRKAAEEVAEAPGCELDSGKVRDFLIFFGSRSLEREAANGQ